MIYYILLPPKQTKYLTDKTIDMILVTPLKMLTTHKKISLSKKGITVIECDDPDKVRIINPESSIDTNDLLLSALSALTCTCPVSKQERFVNDLYKRLSSSINIDKQ